MYKYNSSITRDYILQRYSQEYIFEYILKETIILKKKVYKAPYREDKNGDCFFIYFNEILYFCDFAYHKIHFDCFELYSAIHGIYPPFVYQHILENIPISVYNLKLNNKKLYTSKKKSKTVVATKIYITEKSFTKKELHYWQQYHITKEQLIEDNVKSVKYIRVINDEDITYAPHSICFAYTEWNNCMKIYQPLADKKKKWLSNCKPNNLGGIYTIPNQSSIDATLIITKSYKDCRVLRNMGCFSIWVQNEGCLPSKNLMLSYMNRFTDNVILFDNDEAGKKAAEKLKKHLQKTNLRIIFIEKEGSKDSSDLVKNHGQAELMNFLLQNQIIFINKF